MVDSQHTSADTERRDLDLRRLIAPASIAVIGASADAAGHTGRTLANLVRTGYAGDILPVNPRHDELSGYRCYRSVADLPEHVDTAYVLLRAERVLGVVEELAARGVGTIVVCASGFAELGEEGRRAQQAVRAAARAGGARVLGPNCIGVMNPVDNVIACPTFNITYTFVPGRVAIVSQSGGMGVNIANRAQGRGIGVRTLVSVGNECDIEASEVIDALVDDAETAAIALVLEHVRDAPRFVAAVGRARAAGKPVVALKLGRSDAGRRSALGHTGAMAGEYAVLHDVLRQLGVLEVSGVDELVGVAGLAAVAPRPAGNRLGALSPSGGECSYVADRAVERGLVVPDLSPDTSAALAPLMPLGRPGNPLDPTGAVIGNPDLLATTLRRLIEDPAFDLIDLAVPTWGEYDAEHLLPRFVEAARGATKPVVISAWTARNLTERAEEILRASGVPYFTTADDGVDALAGLYRCWNLDGWTPGPAGPQLARPSWLSGGAAEYDAKRFLASCGLPVPREAFVDTPAAALAAAPEIGWPLVAKLQCTGVVHKSDLGLVRTGINGAEELDRVLADFAGIAERAGLTVEGYLLAEQRHGLELIVGGVHDETFGPVVMVGAGGVLAEHRRDRVFRLCPLDVDQARAALAELDLASVLAGARGRTYAVDALAEVVSGVSRLMVRAPWLREIDLNPVLVDAGGAVVVDAVLALDDRAEAGGAETGGADPSTG